MRNRVLYTGFKKAHVKDKNSSFLLLSSLEEGKCFLFTNDFSNIEREVDEILKEKWDKIVMFGQKPIIKKLYIEKCARREEETLYSNWDVSLIEKSLKAYDIDFKWSLSPGNSYCNHAYFQMLQKVKMEKLQTKVIFIHVPYVGNFIQLERVKNMLEKMSI